jgi:hypothetical protein
MTGRLLRPVTRGNKVAPKPPAPPEITGLQERIRANAFKRPDCDEVKGTGVAYDLERICPDALDLDALARAYLTVEVNGHSPELAGNRGETYFRDQLRNVRVMTTDDVCRLVVQAPAVAVAWLRPLLQSIAAAAPDALGALLADLAPLVGKAVEDLPASPAQLVESFARAMQESSDVAAQVAEASKDGLYAPEELTRIAREAAEAAESHKRVQAAALAMLTKPRSDER